MIYVIGIEEKAGLGHTIYGKDLHFTGVCFGRVKGEYMPLSKMHSERKLSDFPYTLRISRIGREYKIKKNKNYIPKQ